MVVILIELCLFITTGDIMEFDAKKFSEFQELNAVGLKEYINTLMSTEKATLNTDQRIFEATGIPIRLCRKYRKFLIMVRHNKKPVLEIVRGSTKTSYTKEDLYRISSLFLRIISSPVHKKV